MKDAYREFWEYLSAPQRDLIQEGQYLMNDIIRHQSYHFKDYSFLVFPFSKVYEGFLKQLFKDVKFISHLDYISDHLRLGKLMSPQLADRLGDRSLYLKIVNVASPQLAEKIWQTWRIGRNELFHYYPHNIKAIPFAHVETIINTMLVVMEEAYIALKPLIHKSLPQEAR